MVNDQASQSDKKKINLEDPNEVKRLSSILGIGEFRFKVLARSFNYDYSKVKSS